MPTTAELLAGMSARRKGARRVVARLREPDRALLKAVADEADLTIARARKLLLRVADELDQA